jgi:hypothetical protein
MLLSVRAFRQKLVLNISRFCDKNQKLELVEFYVILFILVKNSVISEYYS